MKKTTATFVLIALSASLAACASPQRGPSNDVIARVLTGAPGEAQPSVLVSTEIAYARAAQEQGQFTAGRQYAADGAIFHTRSGGVPFAALADQLTDPEMANEWGPRTVVMSCDGSTALTVGRFRDPEGLVGNYVTAWTRQRDLSYKWTYDVAGYDDPQPPPRRQFEDGDIVVTAIDSVRGLVATCPSARIVLPPAPTDSPVAQGGDDVKVSSDGTLRWRWEHRGENEKYVVAEYFYNGAWVTAIEESLASPDKG